MCVFSHVHKCAGVCVCVCVCMCACVCVHHNSSFFLGYIGSVSFLEKVSEVVTELKRMDKTVCYSQRLSACIKTTCTCKCTWFMQ